MFLDDEEDLLKDIKIYKHKDSFDIVFTRKYRCHVTDYQMKYCVVEHIDENGVFDVYLISYSELGVKNINELFHLLIEKPEEMINILTENDIPIDKLIIEYDED